MRVYRIFITKIWKPQRQSEKPGEASTPSGPMCTICCLQLFDHRSLSEKSDTVAENRLMESILRYSPVCDIYKSINQVLFVTIRDPQEPHFPITPETHRDMI